MLDHVIWPEKFDPRISALYALNEVDVQASPETVWRLLVDAENWKNYFPPEDQVRIRSGEAALELGTRFTRVTVGIPCSLVVEEYVPASRLAWSTLVQGDHSGSSAYHGWVITPTGAGCHVLSEETQQGPYFLAEIGLKSPGGLYKYHQQWVEDLARAAEAGS